MQCEQQNLLLLRGMWPHFIIKATLKSCIDNDLLKVTCKFELKVSAADVTDEQLESYLNDFLEGSSTDLGWSLDKYFEEIKYDMSIGQRSVPCTILRKSCDKRNS
jgi:hypothetical protein